MIVYLAGPMAGYEQMNYPAFEKAARELREMGFIVLSPHEIDHQYPGRAHYNDPGEEWMWYMDKCIPLVFKCAAIFLLEGWEKSKGARIELTIAREREMVIGFYPSEKVKEMALMINAMKAMAQAAIIPDPGELRSEVSPAP